MNQIEYTLFVQRLCIAGAAVSFAGMCAMLVFLDPYVNDLYMWGFLALLVIFITGVTSLILYWWHIAVRKDLLTIPHVNQIVYQSLVAALCVAFVLVLNQTGQFNVLTVSLVGIGYLFYWFWSGIMS